MEEACRESGKFALDKMYAEERAMDEVEPTGVGWTAVTTCKTAWVGAGCPFGIDIILQSNLDRRADDTYIFFS
jgi:hypothetical protein